MGRDTEPDAKRHPIQVVSRRTGLSADVLRAWEKRYGVVEPARSDTGRRLYSDADVEKLRLLHRATEAGRRIGRVAELEVEALQRLVWEDEQAEARARTVFDDRADEADAFLEACLAAVEQFDPRALETALMRAAIRLSAPVLIDEVAAPLMRRIGEGWASGELIPAHEHMASAVMRHVLESLAAACAPDEESPTLVVATPAGQVHEFGALFVAAVAASEGWRVTYLGTDLPAGDIVTVARERAAPAIAVSVVHPEADERVRGELETLAVEAGPGIEVLVGGAAAPSYGDTLEGAGARLVGSLEELRMALRSLAPASPA